MYSYSYSPASSSSSSSSSSSPSSSLFGSPVTSASLGSSASSSTTSASTHKTSSGNTEESESRLHPSSLLPAAAHSPALLALVLMEITPAVIDYVVGFTASTVSAALAHSSDPCSDPEAALLPYLAPFTSFAHRTLARAKVRVPTLLVALAYIARARPLLAIAAPQYALERILLGALVVACKYTQDGAMKNAQWSRCCGLFGMRDVGRVEREFLEVLDWELGVREGELVAVYAELREAEMGGVEGADEEMAQGSKDAPNHLTLESPASSPTSSPRNGSSSRSRSASPCTPSFPSSPSTSPSYAFFFPASVFSPSPSPRTPTPYLVSPPHVAPAPDVPSPTFCPHSPTPSSAPTLSARRHRCKRKRSYSKGGCGGYDDGRERAAKAKRVRVC